MIATRKAFAPASSAGYAPAMGDVDFMRLALRLARRGYGTTSPNPMVGAVLVRGGKLIGRGWHCRAGEPHAEIEALRDAQQRGNSPRGATLYVTLEPCCTHGRTPPCTDAIMAAGIRRVVAGSVDPNPKHSGRAFGLLQSAGIAITRGVLPDECAELNEVFHHWMVHRLPFVTVKAAMTLDGKLATASGESKWITGEKARAYGMKLRLGSDAIVVGINTILADDPSLTARRLKSNRSSSIAKPLRRIILDSLARTPLAAKVVSDDYAEWTTVVVSDRAPKRRVTALARRGKVLVAPTVTNPSTSSARPSLDLHWLLKRLAAEEVTSVLVEGGGEVNASFLLGGLAQRVAFLYAPKILGGRDARKGVAGEGARRWSEVVRLRDIRWRKLSEDFLLTARIEPRTSHRIRH